MNEQTPTIEARKTPEQVNEQVARIASKLVDRAKADGNGFGNKYISSKEGPIVGTQETSTVELSSDGSVDLSKKVSVGIAEAGTSIHLSPNGQASVSETGRAGSADVNRQLDSRDVYQAQAKENILSTVPAQLGELRGSLAAKEIDMDNYRKEQAERFDQKAA